MYNYNDLLVDLKKLRNARIFVIGKTYFNRNIYAIIKGRGRPKALIHGAMHSRENITSKLVMDQAILFENSSICFVPMVNPDGVQLVTSGLSSAPKYAQDFLNTVNNESDDYSLWKANGRAVDINVNFDAKWGQGAQNVTEPSSGDYIGRAPESEFETMAMVRLTEYYKFCVSISYHTKGDVIYYGFDGKTPYMDEAEKISKVTGYPLLTSTGSAGGYKDWFVQDDYGLGLTIEVGDENLSHPLGYDAYPDIWRHNRYVTKTVQEITEEICTQSLWRGR